MPETNYETLATPQTPQKAIMHPGYATGDMFGIAAALINNPNLHVVISTGNGSVNDPTDKGKSIEQFYLDSKIPRERVHLVSVNNIRKANADLKAKAKEIQPRGPISGVTEGTNYVAKYFSEAMRQEIKTAWNVNNSQDNAIKIWLAEKRVPLYGDRVLVLWSRFSGKKGDIHLEHDSSYRGIEQIALEAALGTAPYYDAIIIAGDKGYKDEKAKKYNEIATRVNEAIGARKVFNLTEFWNDKTDTLLSWGGDTRFGQFKLYDYLQRNFQQVKHLGFRSGNLEVMAMLGYEVRYMEEPNSEGGNRMTKWHRSNSLTNTTKDGGLATGYERLLLNEPPTRSGKYLYYLRKNATEAIRDENRRPTWAPVNRHREDKPAAIIQSYKSGFNDANMAIIFNYLRQ